MSLHPIQPLELDEKGVLRFKANAIVRHLLDNGGIGMNALACMDFTREDREQFAQLIGYSHSGSGDLGYVSDEVWQAAIDAHEEGASPDAARAEVLRDRLEAAMAGMRDGIAALYGIHPEDLK